MNISKITGGFRTKLIISVYKNWLKPHEKVLDVGCGTGIVSKILQDKLDVLVTGSDVKNYLIFDLPFIKIKNNSIPVENNSYNAVLLNDVLHHINAKHHTDILKEGVRIAEKVLIFEFEPTLTGKLADIIVNKFHYGDLSAPLALRTKNEWQNLFKSLGLKSKAVELKKPFLYPFAHIAFLVTKK